MVVIPVIVTPQRPVALVRTCQHERRPFELGVIPDEGEQPVLRDVKRVNGEDPFSFRTVLGGAFGPFSGCLSIRASTLWQLYHSGQLSLLSVRRP